MSGEPGTNFPLFSLQPAMHGSTWNWRLLEAQVVQKAQWPVWESIRLIILVPGFDPHQSFDQWLKF